MECDIKKIVEKDVPPEEQRSQDPDEPGDPDKSQQDAPALESTYKHVDGARQGGRDHRTSRFSNAHSIHNALMSHDWIHGVVIYLGGLFILRHCLGILGDMR